MHRRPLIAVVLAQFLCAAAALADITRASLEIQGAGLRVETVSVTTGIDIPTTIQTSFAGRTNDEAPAVDGLLAVGELTGPGIDVPITLTATPGYRFQIPGLPRLGDYYLQNIRLASGNDILQPAAPSLAKITVADLLQTSLAVKQLTPDEIRERGIVVDARNYDVYEYTFTFLVDGKKVEVPFPVVIDPRTHVITPVREEKDYGAPNPVKNVVPPRWTPPDIIPFEFPDVGEEGLPDPGKDPGEKQVNPSRPRIPAALVIPNSMAVLHQFFAVMLTVTNGAPQGSTARLEDVAATMKIKVPQNLRAVKSTPAVAFGQAVPVVDPNTGVTVLIAQSKGEAEWVLEGLRPGTHTVEVDISATLREVGQRDVFLRATPSASVIIHDPRFNITFSHPDTVRKGLDYSTFAFITNMSPQTQTIRVTDGLPQCADRQTPNVCRVSGGPPPSDMTIAAGEMRVVEYRLRAGETGTIFATAGTINDENLTAAVQLHMGVSTSGIPLSPATLVLPHYAQFLDQGLVGDYLELLGLGYSLATAPVNQTTARFPRVIKTDVFYRANDIARAGQRIFITDSSPLARRDALSNLLLDLLGNSIELREWDELRRREDSGRGAGAAVAAQLRASLVEGETTMQNAVERFATATAHRGNFVLALAHAPAGGARPVSIAIRGASGRTAAIANEASDGWVRDLPFADVSRFDAFDRAGELAIAGRWTEDLEIVVTPHTVGSFEVELLYPGTADETTMRARLVVNGAAAGEPIRIPLTRGAANLNALLPNGGFAASAIGSSVDPAPLTILGARQDLHLDPEGHKVSVLFSRPVAVAEGTDLLTRFAGKIDFNKDGVVFNDGRPIFAAALQHDQRVANLSFDHTLSTNASYTIDVAPFVDPTKNASVTFADPVVPKIDNDRPAGILYGKFITGDNKPIPNAEIKFFTGHWVGCPYRETQVELGLACNPFAEAGQYARTLADGSFLFEYVPRDVIADPALSGAYKAVGVTAEGRATAVEGSVRLPGRVHHVNLQLLGRGSAEGKVRYDNGQIAAGVRVHVSSTMFNVGRDAVTDANGFFRVDDLAVGPITFSASDDDGNAAFASGEIATPGQVVVKELTIIRKPFPGTGTVHGRVIRSDNGQPVFGARVGVYTQGYGFAESATDSDGRFEFTKVPSGFVTLLAAEWSISRENVAADFDLRPDETREMNLTLSVTPSDMPFVRVTGLVMRENPLFPGDPSKYEPVPGAVVNLAILTTTADANGRFTFDGVPLIAGDRSNPKTIRAYDPATKRVGSIAVPTLFEDRENEVTVFIPANSYGGGTVRVRLVSAHGLPVDGFRVIEPGFPPKSLVRTGAGIYEYRDAPIGHELDIVAVEGPEDYGEQVAEGTIRLDFPGQTATMILRLPGQGTVRAKLRGDFDLIGDVAITYPVWSEAEQMMEGRTIVQSTSENGVAGFATFAKVPALRTYDVSSAHPVYGYAAATGSLAYDGDLILHTLQLNKLATVRGVVYAIDGITPIANAAVRLYDERRDAGIVYSQPDGTFVFHDVPAATPFHVTAEVTQSGIYRTGIAFGRTPDLGGPAPEVSVILRRRGEVEGKVVYSEYKVYDPDNPANRVPDDTPGDLSDNAPVPLARLWLRELDYPERSFGTSAEPLVADVGGRFAVTDVFIGSLRALAWAADNQEMRGNWTGVLSEEGELLAPVYIAVGTGGTGSVEVKVVDPNQQYLPIANAEVRLYRGGLFDLTTTDDAGLARFDELPIGSYGVDAYSKALGKSGAGAGFTISKDQLTEVRVLLEFVGKVDGRLTDPMIVPSKPLPGVPVRLTASSFYALASTDSQGLFFFEGIREGPFALNAKDLESNRWADGSGSVTPANRRPFVELELEKTETLHVAVYLPNDTGGNSGTLAGPFEMDVVQRCGGGCDYRRTLQGNPLTFPGLFLKSRYPTSPDEPYHVVARELGGAGLTVEGGGIFPKGTAGDPLRLVYPAFGGLEVTVTQGGAAAQGARVEMGQGANQRSLYTDAAGKASGTGFRLGNVTVQATSFDGRFTGSAVVTIARSSQIATATIDLGAYAGVSGFVEAEAGGPSIGTRVLASFAGRTLEILTDSSGGYLFQGIPTTAAGTPVSLSYVGPDGVTVGARREVRITNEWASRVLQITPAVKLDATPPQLLSVTPLDASQNVSPDAPVRLVFSEEIEAADLTSNHLQVFAADGSGQVPATITWSMQDDTTMLVVIRPQQLAGERFPLRSNTLYRIIVHAALRDTTGHRLPAPRGFTFTTSDYAEPRVIKVVPTSTLPLPAQVTLQFHFNEPIDATVPIAFRFEKLTQPNAGTRTGRAYIDPANALFLAFAPDQEIEPESRYRAVFSGIKDLQGNGLAEQTYEFFSFDETKPFLRLISPVPDGVSLVSGVEYTLNVDARNGTADGTPATDVASVEYLRVDGETETFLTTITAAPFAYRFSGPEAPEAGITYTIRAKATDQSGNVGAPATISWTVKPNAAPKNVALTLAPQSAYPGGTVTANVTFEDEGVLAPVQVATRGTNENDTEFVKSEVDEARRANVGQPWPPVAIPFQLPVTLKANATATFTATVTDVRGLSASTTANLTILADTIKPVIVSTAPAAETTYTLNAKYNVSAVVSDAETGVAEVVFVVDGAPYRVLASASTNGPAPGTRLFTSPQITATARNVDTRIPIAVRVVDHHGNVATRGWDVIYIGVNDPTAPKGTWLCPVDRAVVPASQTAFKLPLEVRAQDDVSVTSVTFRVTGLAEPVVATRIGTTDEYEALVTVDTPAEGSDFRIAAIISDADATHTIELPIAIDVVAIDRVIDATEAVDFDTVQLYAGKSLLVRGAGRLVINEPLAVENLIVLDGGRLETLGTTLTRERKLDLTVTDRFYLDCSSTVDVTAKGYLGGWGVNPDGSSVKSDSPSGRTIGNVPTGGATNAAASYGGLGGQLPNGATNALYGSMTDPFDLGSGGAGHETAQHSHGGTGGGAVSLRASDAAEAVGRIVVAGTIRADGGGGSDAFRGRHGGSGGSVRIHARQVVVGPLAQVSANGGAGEPGLAETTHGASGGRIAVTASERLDLTTPLAQLRAFGGAARPAGLAGAPGTVYVRRPGQTDGELHLAQTASPASVSYTRATPLAELTLDKLVLGPFALARLDGEVTAAATEKDPTAAIVMRGAVPTIAATTTPIPNANLIRNTPLDVLLDLGSDGGILTAEVEFSAAPPVRVLTFASYPALVDDHRVVFTAPHDAPLGPATLKVKVTDRADRVFETTAATFTIVDNTAPVIDSFTALPASLYPGKSVTATLTANDDVSVTKISVTGTIGAGTPTTQTRAPNAKVVTNEAFTFAVPLATPGNSTMTVEASVEDGFPGHTAVKQTQTVTILKDAVAPQIAITAPANDHLFQESFGQTFTVRATITDADVAVKGASVRVGEALPVTLAREGETNVFSATVRVPDVDGQQIVTIPVAISASDYENNSATASIDIRVQPIYDPNAPVVRWVCLTQGAMFPAGHSVRLRVHAIGNDVGDNANGVTKVEFFAGDSTTPIVGSSMGSNLFQATYAIPADAADGSTVAIRAVATNLGNRQSDVTARFTIVTGTSITADTTLSDDRYDDQTVIVRGATLTLTAARRFARLLVLEGGKVTHAPATSAGERVDFETGALYVSCDGSIDTNGKGFGTNRTYNDSTTGAATGHSGGSHGGRGGSVNGSAASEYGSLIDPATPGGGGASPSNCGPRCYAGGGVVRVKASTAIVDGSIAANGVWGTSDRNGGAGAGGSIRVEASSIAGYGEVRADGGYSDGLGGGGGGRVALVYDQLLLPRANISARGASGLFGNQHGAAGTVYLRTTAGTDSVTADNNGLVSTHITRVADLGSGTITAVSGNALTLSAAVPEWIAGSWIELLDASGNVTAAQEITARTATTVAVRDAAGIAAGTAYRGAWRFGEAIAAGRATLQFGGVTVPMLTVASSGALIASEARGSDVTLRGGAIELARAKVNNLTVTGNAAVTHPAMDRMQLDVTGTLTIDAGASLDATGRGLGSNKTANDTAAGASTGHSGGSHGGRGGPHSGTSAGEFGSLFDPDTHGGGGAYVGTCDRCASGGGIIRIKAGSVVVNGSILSAGIWDSVRSHGGAGAGGSIRIDAASISGSGAIRADGGFSNGLGGGGGGRVALFYDQLTVPRANISARGGSGLFTNQHGSAGTVYLRANGGADLLVVDNNNLVSPFATRLSDLGSGTVTAVDGSVLTLSNPVPEWIAGSWLELLDATGQVTAAYEITARTATTVTVTLNGGSVAPGTAYRGAWRFAEVIASGRAVLEMEGVTTPVLTAGSSGSMLLGELRGTDVTLQGGLFELRGAKVNNLTIGGAATVTHPSMRRMNLDVAGTLTIAAGGSIDVSGRGLLSNRTWNDTASGASTGHSGGSHGGRGGQHSGTSASEFGSIFDPDTPGGGGAQSRNCPSCNAGGGIVRIKAASVVVDGKIVSAGLWDTQGSNGGAGAGGSIRIDAPSISGAGEVRADGGFSNGLGGGGGGRVALYFDDLAVPRANISARGGSGLFANQHGTAGSVYLRKSGAPDAVTFDNGNLATPFPTRTIDLGSGTITAVEGSTLTLSHAVPEFLAGSYLQLLDANGNVTALHEITARTATSVTVRLDAGQTIAAGTAYRGAWRFGELAVANRGRLQLDSVNGTPTLTALANSAFLIDDVRGTDVTLKGGGSFEVTQAKLANLTLADAAVLTHPRTDAATIRRLTLDVSGTLTVSSGSSIDADGRGFLANLTWNNSAAGASTGHSGGSHGGRGAHHSGVSASEYGSLYDPDTPGGGGAQSRNCPSCNAGGGIIRIKAASVVNDGRIAAGGVWDTAGSNGGAGAGGSVRIDAASIGGSGLIHADGGFSNGLGGGGGGRVALYFDTLTIPPAKITARGASGLFNGQHGAPGTVFLKSSAQAFGDLIVANDLATARTTRATSVGVRTLDELGTHTLRDVGANFPAPNHLTGIRVFTGTDRAKRWKITANTADTITVDASAEPLTGAAGAPFRGVQTFDKLTLRNANFEIEDLLEYTTLDKDAPSTVAGNNDAPPRIDTAKIALQLTATGSALIGSAGAVTDPDQPVRVFVTNTRTSLTTTHTVAADGSFAAAVQGNAGDAIVLFARDANVFPLDSATVGVGTLAESTPTPTQLPKTEWTSEAGFKPQIIGADGDVLVTSSWSFNGGSSDKLALFSIADPQRPAFQRLVSTAAGAVRDFTIVDGWAYVVGDRLTTLDLRNPSSTINHAPDRNGFEQAVAVSRGYAFVSEYFNTDGRIHVFDVSNPAAPRFLRTHVTGPSGDLVYTDLLFLGGDHLVALTDSQGGWDVVVIDRRDVHNLVRVGALQIPNFAGWRGSIDGRYLYLTASNSAELVIVDLQNPAAPSIAARVPLAAFAGNVRVAGGMTFVAASSAGLVTTSLAPNAAVTGSASTGGSALDVAIAAGHAYIANEIGIAVLPISIAPLIDTTKIALSLNAGTVEVRGAYRAITGAGTLSATITNTTGGASANVTVAADGSFTTTLAGNGGDAIAITATDALNRTTGPLSLGSVPFGSSSTLVPIVIAGDDFRARTVQIEGKWLVTGSYPAYNSGSSRLPVYDISNPAAPVQTRVTQVPYGHVRDFTISGGWLYAVGDDFFLHNLENPAGGWITAPARNGYENAVAVAGGYAFTTEDFNSDGRVHVYDISVPTAPRFLATHVTAGVGDNIYYDLLVYGDYLIGLSAGSGGRDVVVIDRRDVNALVRVGFLSIPGIAAFRGRIAGTKLYIAGQEGGVAMVDLTTPSNPTLVSVINTPGISFGLDAIGTTVISADRGGAVFFDTAGGTLVQQGIQPTGGDAWDVAIAGTAAYVAVEQGLVVIRDVAAPPRIVSAFLTVAANGTVTGAPYAITGAAPLSVELRNATTGAAMTVTANANGSFTAALPASPGDAMTVKATDAYGRASGPVNAGTVPFGSSTTLLPITGTGDGNFRARTVKTEGKWAVVSSYPGYGTSSGRIVVYDITNRAAPVQTRVTNPPYGAVRDLEIFGGWLYVTGDDFFYTNLNDPAGTWYTAPARNGFENAVAVADGYAFTSEDFNSDGRVHVYDISNPAAPKFVRTQPTAGIGDAIYSDLIAYGAHYLVALSFGAGGRDVVILDRRDVNNIVRLAHLSIPSLAAFRGRIAGSTLYLAGQTGGVAMVDLTNPASPQLLSVFDTPANALGLDASGSAVMVADRGTGVIFLDATGGVLRQLGTHVTGGDAWDCALAGPVLYVANEQGLVVIDGVFAPPRIEARFITVHANGTVAGAASAITGQAPLGVTVKNASTGATSTITANGDGSFGTSIASSAGDTITVSATDAHGRSAGPVVVGRIPFGTATRVLPITTSHANYRARAMKVEGTRAVVGGFNDYGTSTPHMVVFDLTNPAAPVQTRVAAPNYGDVRDYELIDGMLYIVGDDFFTLDLKGPASTPVTAPARNGLESAVAVANGYAYTSEDFNSDGRIHVYDVTNPAVPRHIATSGGTAGVGDNIYLDLIPYGSDYLIGISPNAGGRDVVLIDRRDPQDLRHAGFLSIPQIAGFRGKLAGNTLYVAGREGGVAMIDLTNPASPQLVSLVDTPGMAYGIEAAGSTVMVADRGAGVTFLDSSTGTLRLLGTHVTGGDAWDLALGGSTLYVANEQGMVVIENVPAAPDIESGFITITNAGPGVVTVAGSARAVGGHHPLSVEARATATTTVTANADGSFSASLAAINGEAISIRVTDAAGRIATHVVGAAPFFTITLSQPARDADGAMWGRRILTDGTNIAVAPGTLFANRRHSSDRMTLFRPPSASFFSTGSVIDDMEVRANFALLAGDRFHTVDFTAATPVRYFADQDRSGVERAVTSIGTFAFVSEGNWNRNGTIHVYNVASMTAPLYTTSKAMSSAGGIDYFDLTAAGNYLIAISPEISRDVTIIDATVPANLTRLAELDVPSFTAFAGVVSGSTLYLAGGNAGIAIVDIGNPAAPAHIATIDTPGSARRVAMAGANRLVVADSSRGLTFIDVSNRAAPRILGNQLVPGTASDVVVIGTELFVAAETRFYRLGSIPE